MGWSYGSKPDNVKEYFTNQLNYSRDGFSQRCLDIAIVNLKTIYAAVEQVGNDGIKNVSAAIIAINFITKKEDGFKSTEFGYKDMDETMGCYQTDCPERILKLLTPTDNEYAKAWREACWSRINKRKENKVSDGDVIRFNEKIRFSSGNSYDTFKVIVRQGKATLMCIDEYGYHLFRAKLGDWREREFKKLEGDDIPKPPERGMGM